LICSPIASLTAPFIGVCALSLMPLLSAPVRLARHLSYHIVPARE
jgi:hypothetical protein